MEWNELVPLLDRLEDTKRPGEVTSAITKAKKDMHFIGGYAAFIRMVVLRDAGVQPKLNVVPPNKRVPMEPLLEDGWIWGHKGAFNHRTDPQKLIDFCSPYSSKRDKFRDELTEPQKNMSEMIYEDVEAAKRRERQSVNGPNTIEDALNDVVRKKLREEGSDPV